MKATFRRYRLLIIVVTFLVIVSLQENSERDSQSKETDEQLPYVMHALYPNSARVEYALAVQSVMNNDLKAARAHFEAALATGEKTNEDLFYYYAVTLVRMRARPEEIDAAVKAWRFNFPYSDRSDPKTAAARPAAKSTVENSGSSDGGPQRRNRSQTAVETATQCLD